MSKKVPAALQASHPESVFVELAHAAVLELTEAHTFRLPPTVVTAEGVATVAFHSAHPGYPGWSWTVSLSDLPDIVPTVLELELLPGETSLISPPWTPWADRMEEYLIHEKELAAATAESADDDDDDDDVDFDDDVDGLDIDQLDIGLDPSPLEIPEERIGLVFVFRVFDNISYGMVMNTGVDNVGVGYSLRNPK